MSVCFKLRDPFESYKTEAILETSFQSKCLLGRQNTCSWEFCARKLVPHPHPLLALNSATNAHFSPMPPALPINSPLKNVLCIYSSQDMEAT